VTTETTVVPPSTASPTVVPDFETTVKPAEATATTEQPETTLSPTENPTTEPVVTPSAQETQKPEETAIPTAKPKATVVPVETSKPSVTTEPTVPSSQETQVPENVTTQAPETPAVTEPIVQTPNVTDSANTQTPSVENSEEEDDEDTEIVVAPKGTVLSDTSGEGSYVVTKANEKSGTVTYTGTEEDASGTVKIPNTITVDGVSYKVTAVADKAFQNDKEITQAVIGKNINKIGSQVFKGCSNLKTIRITSTKLTAKGISKNAFKGVSSKVTIKVPKSKLKQYTKLFRKKGLSKKVKIKAI
jgi:hypothetical protein